MLRRFASNPPGGPLEAPWEVVLAPPGFGRASHQLLVGEVDSGEISVFNPETGAFLGQLADSHGKPIVIDGVWALIFKSGDRADIPPRLFFAAGCAFPPDYSPSVFGYISMANAGGGAELEAGSVPLPLIRPKTRITRKN